MQRMTLEETRMSATILVLLLPVFTFLFLLVLPLEIWRNRRQRRHNHLMQARLAVDVDSHDPQRASPYRKASSSVERLADQGENNLALQQADNLVVANYRIRSAQGRFLLCGTAVFALHQQEQQLVSLTAYRSVPKYDLEDEGLLKTALERRYRVAVEQMHWAWEERDPYGLEERETKPW